MALSIPPHIANANVAGAAARYKWNSEIGLKFYAAKDQNVRLYKAVDEADFRSKFGLGVAITEWIVWRFQGLADVSDALRRVEAAWAAMTTPRAATGLKLVMSHDDDREPVAGALELALCNLGDLVQEYAEGSIYLAEIVVKQAMLARHLMPDKKAFDDWLAAIVRQMAQSRPRNAKYDRRTGVYDYAHEPPLSRESFGAEFRVDDPAAQDVFLKSLDPRENPYLG
ncbi:hypothetical protein [Piscinibacter sp. XHJ-5]|uniref:hypothetical protein n=1 Tax=Piscinibacter sp. XHJ-5 TaxID=3037797 RepID=UPI0024533A00|nr:hypothetical protein [Piscinibacter sp. XHJ-5]